MTISHLRPRTDTTRDPDHRHPFLFAIVACVLVTAVTVMLTGLP